MPFPSVTSQKRMTHLEFFSPTTHTHGRVEYVNGTLYAVPSQGRNHQQVVDNLLRALRPQVTHSPCTLLEDTLVGNGPPPLADTPPGRHSHAKSGIFCRPTVALLAYPASYFVPGTSVVTNPTALLEVVAPGEEDYVSGPRFEALRTWVSDALHEYVLVTTDRLEVAHYRRVGPRDWSLDVLSTPDAVLTLSRVGCAVTLAEVYSGVRDRGGRPFVGAVCPHCGKHLY